MGTKKNVSGRKIGMLIKSIHGHVWVLGSAALDNKLPIKQRYHSFKIQTVLCYNMQILTELLKFKIAIALISLSPKMYGSDVKHKTSACA